MAKEISNLKKARLLRGLRQFDLAQRVGIATSRISFFENGLVDPSSDIKKKIAKALGCQVDKLFKEGENG